MTHQKRISAPKHYDIERKGLTYVSTSEGSRPQSSSIPVLLFLREITGYADNKKEAKKIIRDGQITRNGDRLSDVRDAVGVMDVVKIRETGEAYRVLPSKDAIVFAETEDERPAAKIKDKSKEGGDFVYRLHNGENYRSEEEYSRGSTLIFEDQTTEHKISEGAEALVTEGSHAGSTVEVTELHERGMRPDTATVSNEREFEIEQGLLFAKGDLEVADRE